jgi:hypothetical protein
MSRALGEAHRRYTRFINARGRWTGHSSAFLIAYRPNVATLLPAIADADAIQQAQQANSLSINSSFTDLHTLACVYAAQGKTTEAKQVLLQAMDAAKLEQPNSEVCFGFGALYEQYGVTGAAIEAFRKVTKPQGTISATDAYVLAQTHLKELKASQ